MLAWQATGYGPPAEVLELRDVACPEPGPGELRLRVEAASLNPIDYKLLRGELRAVMPLRFPVTPGFDACGTVDALGQGVDDLEVGMQFQAQTPQGALPVVVSKVEGDEVTVDANHPLAGQVLHFAVEVTGVRDASLEELTHGHVHGEGGHHH